jgi:hypothetical protein
MIVSFVVWFEFLCKQCRQLDLIPTAIVPATCGQARVLHRDAGMGRN